jgi:HK97 family phage major capsid protein
VTTLKEKLGRITNATERSLSAITDPLAHEHAFSLANWLTFTGSFAQESDIAEFEAAMQEAATGNGARLAAMEQRTRRYRAFTDTKDGRPVTPEEIRQINGGTSPARQSAVFVTWAELADQIERDSADPTNSPEYRDAYIEHLMSGGRYFPQEMVEADRTLKHDRYGLSVSSDPGGGYSMPAEFRAEFIRNVPAASPIMALVRVLPVDNFPLTMPRIQPDATSPNVYGSASIASMVAETGGGGEADPVFGQFVINGKFMRVFTKVSRYFAANPNFDVNALLRDDHSTNAGLKGEQQVIAGDGIANNILGIIAHDQEVAASATVDQIPTVDVEGSVTDTISNATDDAGSAPKILDLVYQVPAQYRRRPGFRVVGTSATEKALRKLVDANSRTLWGSDQLLGDVRDAFEVSEFMEDDGADGNKVLLAGDFSNLIVATRGSIDSQVLVERYADTDQIAVITRWHLGAGVSIPHAFAIGVIPS